ncbi:MAG: hypothetical protein JWR36_1124 [Glaciihabitans sp.]|jgi:hypothetical protein|nr:hypothetical protein [Glaciihabitans sp.]MDQ1569544.1 hypothetical protein [Actinomycetota bacterium]
MTDPTNPTDPTPPTDPEKKKSWFSAGGDKAKITANRVILWVLVGGFGLYLIITGIVGILTKAR